MLDVALIEKCADPSLTPAIVEHFVEAAGSHDPLAVTVKSGGRLILVPKPKSAEEAMAIVRDNIGRAVVRVGLTQFPAGVGIKEVSELKDDIVDPCENLRMGTTMLAKIMRIVAKRYGNPTGKDVLPQIFEDAAYSWKTSEFEGVGVFQAEDPGAGWRATDSSASSGVPPQNEGNDGAEEEERALTPDAGQAEIHIDLSRINGK